MPEFERSLKAMSLRGWAEIGLSSASVKVAAKAILYAMSTNVLASYGGKTVEGKASFGLVVK